MRRFLTAAGLWDNMLAERYARGERVTAADLFRTWREAWRQAPAAA